MKLRLSFRPPAIVLALAFSALVASWAFATSPAAPNNQPPGGTARVTYAPAGITSVGSVEVNGIGPAASPSLTVNTAGTSSQSYYCVAEDQNAVASTGEGEGAPSGAASTTTAALPPNTTVTCSGDPRTVSFLVLKANTSHYLARCYAVGGSCSVTDSSTTAGTAYTANTTDQTAKVLGGLSSVSGASDFRRVRIAGTATLIQGISSPVTMCTTSGLNGACNEPTAILSPGFPDANYTASCSCTSVGTNVPEIYSVTKASNSLVVGIVSAGATPSASCAVVDCLLVHD